jgi:lysozyme
MDRGIPMTLVIDLSHHNTIPASLIPAREAGVRGLIHKATEATGFVDKKVQARYVLAKEAGLLWGLYHFMRPGKIHEQAKYFLSAARNLGVLDDNTLLACDHEDENVSLEDVLIFMKIVEIEAIRAPVLYSGHVLKEQMAKKPVMELTQYRLWLAQYSSKATMPKGWSAYWLWQYTDKGEVPGIDPPTDLNKYDASEEDLRIEWSGREEGLAPPVAPLEGAKVVTVTVPEGVEVVVERK